MDENPILPVFLRTLLLGCICLIFWLLTVHHVIAVMKHIALWTETSKQQCLPYKLSFFLLFMLVTCLLKVVVFLSAAMIVFLCDAFCVATKVCLRYMYMHENTCTLLQKWDLGLESDASLYCHVMYYSYLLSQVMYWSFVLYYQLCYSKQRIISYPAKKRSHCIWHHFFFFNMIC